MTRSDDQAIVCVQAATNMADRAAAKTLQILKWKKYEECSFKLRYGATYTEKSINYKYGEFAFFLISISADHF